MDEYNEFLVPDTPPENEGYTSGNPSQYASHIHDDSSDFNDPEYQVSSDSDPFVDEFPSKLTKALLPVAQSQGDEHVDSDDEIEEEGDKLTEEQERWLDYNDDEVQLISTMRNAEEQDLGHQLVNVHGLKTTRYDWDKLHSGEVKNYHHKRRWQREVPDEEAERKAFETDDTWAEWPLEPWNVPRMGEEEVLAERRWGEEVRPWMRAGLAYKPSAELEEHLGAATMKWVGKKWHRRKFTKVDEGESSEEEDEEEVMRELGIVRQEDSEEKEKEEEGGYRHAANAASAAKEPEELRMQEVEEDVWRRTYRRYRDRGEPDLDSDDVVNAERMKPAISHAMSRLDDLLLALRRNRTAAETADEFRPTSRNGEHSQAGSAYESEAPSDADSQLRSGSGSRGRPRKKRKLDEIPEAPKSNHTEKNGVRRGRPRKVHVPLEGETERQMLIRVAREQKKPIPLFSDEEMEEEALIKDEYYDVEMPVREGDGEEQEEEEGEEEEEEEEEGGQDENGNVDEDQEEDEGDDEEEAEEWKPIPDPNAPAEFVPITQDEILKDSDGDSDDLTSEAVLAPYDNWPFPEESWPDRKARILAKREAKAAEEKEESLKYASRDWSDVVGVAALIGFPPKVIERTVARLTSMLGEKMDLRVFTRLPAGDTETLVKYRPDEIPSDDGLFGSSSEEESSSEGEEGDDEEDEDDDDDGMDTSLDGNTRSKKSASTHSRSSSQDTKMENENQDSDNELSSASDSSSSGSDEENRPGYQCPIEDCDRHHEGKEVSSQKALRAHLRKKHGWTEGDIEDFYDVETDEEEMLEGVHRDGWLKRIKAEKVYDGRREMEGGVGSGSGSETEYDPEEEDDWGSPEL